MSRQRPDPAEVPRPLPGPLFAPVTERVTLLSGTTDPPSSVRAAARVIRTGTVRLDEQLLLTLIENHPGATMIEIGEYAARLHGGSAIEWRYRLGKRTGPLKAARLIHAVDDRESGLGRWRLGAAPDAFDAMVRS